MKLTRKDKVKILRILNMSKQVKSDYKLELSKKVLNAK